MNNDGQIKEIINMIQHTDEYNEIKKAIKILRQYPELVKKIRSLQLQQNELQKSKLSKKSFESKWNQINQSFSYLSQYKQVKYYINSMQKFNLITNKIFKVIETDLKI